MRPSLVLFDVNETLADLSPLGARFFAVGASASSASVWFASVLRDGFALTIAGDQPTFAEVAEEELRALLSQVFLNRPLDEAVEHVLDGLQELPAHPDVAPGVTALADQGLRLATLSNGAVGIAEGLLTQAGVRDRFERLLSVDDAGVWKPASGSYEYAATQLGLPVEEIALVAVHPWDVDGARRAGLQTVWLNRSEGEFPRCFAAADVVVTDLEQLAPRWG